MSATTVQEVPLAKLVPSRNNPRFIKDEDAIASLAKSIAEDGVLEPVLVRPHPKSKGKFELLAGWRRFQASQVAKKTSIPAIVREVDDDTAIRITIVENMQREDLHPLEEAKGIRTFMDRGWTAKQIGDEIGKTAKFVARRAALTGLTDKWRKALLGKQRITRWPVGCFEQIAALAPATQDKALAELNRCAWMNPDTPAEMARWLAGRYTMNLHAAPWRKDDETLVPKAGSCINCPKRSGAQPLLFDDDANGDEHGASTKIGKGEICTDGACFAEKAAATLERKIARLDGKVVLLDDGGGPTGSLDDVVRKRLAGQGRKVVQAYNVERVKKGDKGAVPAMVVAGSGLGTRTYVRPFGGGRSNGTSRRVKGGPTPLKERRAQLERRRAGQVVVWVLKRLEEDREAVAKRLAAKRSIGEVMAAATVFGTSERCGCADYGDGPTSDWRLYEQASKDAAEAATQLWRKVVPVLEDRLRFHNLDGIKFKLREAEKVCWLLDWEMGRAVEEAAKTLPEPAGWAKLNADGTPKKAKKTASKKAASRTSKKK